jgi:TolB-like protein
MNKILSSLLFPFLLCFVVLVATACSNLNGTRMEPVFGADVNLVKLGDRVAEILITRAHPPLFPQQPILVTTLVNNDNLDDTTSFGRSFQNNVTAGFVGRGYAVREIKLRRDLLVESYRGEFMLTRDLQELAEKERAQAVVVGTYTMANRAMYLSVRLVDPTDRSIRSVYEDKLYLDANSLRMLGLMIDHQAADAASEQIYPPSPSILNRIFY